MIIFLENIGNISIPLNLLNYYQDSFTYSKDFNLKSTELLLMDKDDEYSFADLTLFVDGLKILFSTLIKIKLYYKKINEYNIQIGMKYKLLHVNEYGDSLVIPLLIIQLIAKYLSLQTIEDLYPLLFYKVDYGYKFIKNSGLFQFGVHPINYNEKDQQLRIIPNLIDFESSSSSSIKIRVNFWTKIRSTSFRETKYLNN